MPSIIFGVGALLLTLFVLQRALPLYGTIWILLIVFVIARISYGTRMTNSGLIQIHAELEESALVSGASTWQAFRRVTMPLLAPTLLYAWLWIALLDVPRARRSPSSSRPPTTSPSRWWCGACGSAAGSGRRPRSPWSCC